MDSYFNQWVIIYSYHYLFCCLNCPRFDQWEPPSGWLLYPFLTFLCHSLSIHLLSGTIQCFRPSLYFPCSIPGIGQFSKDDWSFLMDNNIWKPKLEHCMCSLLLMCQCFQVFPKDRVRKYQYLLYTYIYLNISIWINILQTMSSY